MWTPVVIEAEIGAERGRAAHRTAVGDAVGPLAQERLDEALGLAVGLRAIGARVPLADGPGATDATEGPRSIGHRVVSEQPANPHAAPVKPGERATEERGAGRGI